MKQPTVLGYMADQPRALQEALKNHEVYTKPFVEKLHDKKIKKIIFFGSGTSYNAAIVAAYYFKQILNIDAIAQYPTVFEKYEKADWTNTLKDDEILFVGISQSGTSISTVDVMKYAKAKGYQSVALTEALDSEITKHVDSVIHLLCGKEETPPETRGYTVTLFTLYMWVITTAYDWGVYDEVRYQEALQEVKALCDNFDIVMKESEAWYDRNKVTMANSDRIYIIGYGVDYGTVLEGMLKIGEMFRLPSIGYELEEFSHGPTMALTPRQTLFMIGSEDAEWDRMLTFRTAFKKYTDRVHLVTCKDTEHDDRDLVFSVKTNKYLAPLMYTVPFQFVAAKGAKDIGIDTGVNPFKEPLAHLEE
ncbi:glucoselysine-6-phosphate deglycase [Breznakia sp. PF5-3]|uniref:SIS domain-containing protein n=1 Tax=unclassified Breznakia TaxID=2623764 RepID=UPI0024064F06|nr:MULTISPECIES: SIS domain-containing protein [unclassified Breznakia]MDL2276491.1 SIS domain-containing protein [Breznakia sp. OttesenSCG-928-G09]MDF9824251.1 glucoselysine-6-phosphate deglycase [Breznakia sp. PM6-1]MDF9835182.1 glucoselysine-6-phosphate deglycase [Breznakia sp. PF5-3]MDF9837294.1 glucoselysine-6-phosphate deglycase [Breznakia sp. PFB2-8]MDF9859429.1 glucoselysine-6-phosphate deglycase [Breznakia sp. PH5-24]